jgi:type VI secretion system secreted protein Hcp
MSAYSSLTITDGRDRLLDIRAFQKGDSSMNKLNIILTIGLTILIPLVLLSGCRSVPLLDQEPIPAETPSTEPEQPTEPEATTEPVDDEDDYEITSEPIMHSSAYVKFEGIDGESKIVGHEDWSEIVSFIQAISTPSGGAMGTTRRSGEVILEDIVIVKQIDKSSPKLAEKCIKGEIFPKVEIHLTGPSDGSTCEGTFYAYELKNVMITNYKVTGSNPLAYALIAPAPEITMPSSGPFIVQAVDAPVEELSLNFEEIKVTYTECDSAGNAMGNVEYSWKVEEGES